MAAKKKITTKRSSGAAKPRSEAAKKRAAEKRAFRMALKRYNISEATNPRRYNVYISPSHPKSPKQFTYNGKTYHRVVLSKSSTGKDRLVKYTAGSPSSAKGAKRKRGSTGSSKGQPAKRARAAPATKKRKGGPTVGGSTRMSTRSQKTRGGGSMRRWGDGSGFGGRNMTAQDCRFLKADMEENNESCNADGGPPSVFCDLYIKYKQKYNLHCR